MWFEDLMDDCKGALALVLDNFGISLPYILHSLVIILCAFLLIFGFMAILLGAVGVSAYLENWLWMLPGFLAGGALFALVLSAVNAVMEAGSVSLFVAAAAGESATAQVFWGGVRRYFLPMWGIMLFLNLLALVLSPVLAVLLALVLLAGGLSAGWGFLVIPVIVTVFLGAWPVALVLDNNGGFKALGNGIRLGKRYFGGMFILGLATALLGSSISSVLGPLGALLLGWVGAAFVRTWSKLAILMIYKRRRLELQG